MTHQGDAVNRGGGPKTKAGKRRSSRNAVTHGLNTIKPSNPRYSVRIAKLAKRMCGNLDDAQLYGYALAVAECDFFLCEIRQHAVHLIERLLNENAFTTFNRQLKKTMKAIMDCVDRPEPGAVDRVYPNWSSPENLAGWPDNVPEEALTIHALFWEGFPRSRKLPEAIRLAMPALMRAERYERRAWSRRSRAFQRFILRREFIIRNVSGIVA